MLLAQPVRFLPLLVLASALLAPSLALADKTIQPVTAIAELIRPAKLATLKNRAINDRLQKSVYWLSQSRQFGSSPKKVAAQAVALAGYTNRLARQLTADSLVHNLDLAARYGCLAAAGLEDMRRGQSPTIRSRAYRGDQLSVDHIVPIAVCPELENVIANLELMPLRQNKAKGDKVTAKTVNKARELHRASLLSRAGLILVEHSLIR